MKPKGNFKVLINAPNLNNGFGGVSNHFLGLSTYFSRDQINFCHTGGLRKHNKLIAFPIYIYQYLKFIIKLLAFRPDIIHLNPSLCYDSVIRDGIYLLISKFFRKQVIVFWHGWKDEFENHIEKKYLRHFREVFNKADGFIVLSSKVKDKLINWGFTQPILFTTTKVDDYLVKGFEIEKKERNSGILFLGRLEENKGIFETLRAFQISSRSHPHLTLTFAGQGPDEKKLMGMIQDEEIQNVSMIGVVKDGKKIQTFQKADIFILPSYTEGIPTTVLEAMAFGIPVITRPVGGIPDFFIDEQMGYLVESKDPEDFADRINRLCSDENQWLQISRFNYNYARENFMASKIASEMLVFYESIFNKRKRSNV